jgi:lipopolysaccharide heptosyltransferase II
VVVVSFVGLVLKACDREMTVAVDPTKISRLVVRTPNWLGDAVMALPAIGAVRSAFGSAHMTVAAIPSIAPLFEERTNAWQDAVLTISDPRHEPHTLAAGQFDAVLLLPNSFRSAWAARRASIAQRWGYSGHLRAWVLTRAVHPPRGRVHQSVYYLELIRGLGLPTPEELPRIAITPQTQTRAAALLADRGIPSGARAVGFAPGAAYGHAKRWPPRRVTDVIVRLTREQGVHCILVGAAADREAGREIESSLPHDVRAVNLIGRTDLRLVSGVMARCSAFVSNDSGAMHLAAALGVPVAAIFGPTDDRVTAPLGDHDVLIHQVFCRPCMLRECPIDHRCMKGITPDAVMAAVGRRLEAVR